MRVIDPVEWAMRKDERERPAGLRSWRDRFTGQASYLPLAETRVPGTRLEEPVRPRRRSRSEYAEDEHALMENFGALMERKANELQQRGEVVIRTTEGDVSARIVLYKDGGVFEHRAISPHAEGQGMVRIERGELEDLLPVLVRHLVGAVLDLGAGTRPLD